MTALADPMATLLACSDTADDGLRFGWLGEDGELAYALGHSVTDEAFAAVLDFDYEPEGHGFQRGYLFLSDHADGCDLDGCCCDDFAWWGTFSERFSPGGVAVTWWSA